MKTNILSTKEIIDAVNDLLQKTETGLEVDEDDGRLGCDQEIKGNRPELLVLELKGEPVDRFDKKYKTPDGRLLLRWMLPIRDGEACSVIDLTRRRREDRLWACPMIFRMGYFDTYNPKEISPLKLCPDLDRQDSGVYPAWWRYVKLVWQDFAKRLKKGKMRLTIRDFAKLEAGLNAVFVSARARKRARIYYDASEGAEKNPLRKLEDERNVLIEWPVRSLGRLRIPHDSHRGRLGPFQTPESDRIGLSLSLAAGAGLSHTGGIEHGRIDEGEELLSIASGLIPYPTHTDGPRLMMGGKNMKQAEIGIAQPEAPIVPGYYEGRERMPKTLRKILKDHKNLDENNNYFKPALGVNALTVIMPFEGYTYEDGLVISDELRDRLNIPDGNYACRKRFSVVITGKDFREAGLEDMDGLENFLQNMLYESGKGKIFVYGDELFPSDGLGIPFRRVDDVGLSEIYPHHAPGELESVSVDCESERGEDVKDIHVDIIFTWQFKVNRPMGVGDKLTGRNGNKGVVAKVLPKEQMPKVHFSDGSAEYAELIISPSSIMGRKNLGQIWEMTHSLLIKKGEDRLREIRRDRSIDYPIDPNPDSGSGGVAWEDISSILRGITGDERGTCEISVQGKPVGRAFAGWQYFCRLHHHAWKKLQARGSKGPSSMVTGQPLTCGSRTGQRMGEMENWSLLSHGAEEILMRMRETQTGDFERTTELLKKVLLSLGIETVKRDRILTFVPRKKGDVPSKDLQEILEYLRTHENTDSFRAGKLWPKDTKNLRESIEDILKEFQNAPHKVEDDEERDSFAAEHLYDVRDADSMNIDDASDDGDDHDRPDGENFEERGSVETEEKDKKGFDKDKFANKVRAIINMEGFFDEDGAMYVDTSLLHYFRDLRAGEDGDKDKRGSLYALLRGPTPYYQLKGLIQYCDGLIDLLSHKEGIPRRLLLGRRYNHSGRAVIVPKPELDVHEVRLPIAMLIELLDGYDKEFLDKLDKKLRGTRELRGIVNDIPEKQIEAGKRAKMMDDHLQRYPLWAFLVRQPSLHRHSVQAFRIRCWEQPVIGFPPLVTPGFNADFDGDTMAVFLPPYAYAKDLERFSIVENPGLVGTGAPALAAGLDLALGWWNLEDAKRKRWYKEISSKAPANKEKLSAYLPKLLKAFQSQDTSLSHEERDKERSRKLGEKLSALQRDICKASTAAVTLAPGDFEEMCRVCEGISEELERPDEEAIQPWKLDTDAKKAQVNEVTKNAEALIKGFIYKEEVLENGLSVMVRAGAKGGVKECREMTWAIGEVEKMKDEDPAPQKGQEAYEKEDVFIPGNFWRGLSENALFAYSYPSRYSMAQKKLSVADAGYLSRQLAEGLYELTVTKENCGTQEGLRVAYENRALARPYLTVEGIPVPTLGDGEDTRKDLERIAWGRVPVGLDFCLDDDYLDFIEAYWRGENPDTKGEHTLEKLKEHLDDEGHKGQLVLRSPLFCKEGEQGHVCGLCCGADLAKKPYDNPEPLKEGYVGLTAAQAIGERGTQLAMKRFHEVAGGKADGQKGDVENKTREPIAEIRRLIVSGKMITKKEMQNLLAGDIEKKERKVLLQSLAKKIPWLQKKLDDWGPEERRNAALWTLFWRVLIKDFKTSPPLENGDGRQIASADSEQPQALIHYELALMQLLRQNRKESGLDVVAKQPKGRFLSALAHGAVRGVVNFGEPSILEDDLSSIKSRLMWGRRR